MNNNIDAGDFFSRQNSVESVNESDCEKTGLIIEAARAFERITSQCVYIIDCFKKEFRYVSSNISRLCGWEAENIRDFIDCVSPEDLKILVEITNKGFRLFNTLPIRERKDYTMSYDLHVIKEGKKQLVNYKLTPLILTKDGRIWLAMCTISLAARNKAGNVIMRKSGSEMFYLYSLYHHKWEEINEAVLTDREHEVLTLSTQGYTMAEIADNICKSVDTVKACRRSIFQKLDVRNITEAVVYAQNNQLI